MNECLVLVDIQNDYFPGGSMELVEMEKAAANARMLLEAFRSAGAPIVFIRHLSVRPGSSFFIPGTKGSEINAMVPPREDETVIEKNFPNSFRNTGFHDHLKNRHIEHLVVCGAMSHMCIDATTRAAFDLGFGCTIAEDACATRDLTFQGKLIKAPEVHASFMAALSAPYAQVVTTREILDSRK